jgi:DNA invertase Pin-like site-specific DNA recombinase
MAATSSFGRSRGDFERACRAAFKQLERAAAPDALDALEAVELAAAEVRAALVDRLRSEGYSWADVGEVFGVSRQAVYQRFGA